MRRILKVEKIILVLFLLSSCTSGGSSTGSGGSTGGSSGGGGGNIGGGSSFGGSTGGGSSGGSSTTGGVTGGTTGIGGGTGGGGGSSGGATTTASVRIDASSGMASTPYSVPLNSSNTPRLLDLTVDISNATAFQNIITLPNNSIVTKTLNAPNQDLLVPGTGNLITTSALIAQDDINTLNYPTRSADANLVAGAYLQKIQFGAGDASSSTGVVLAKNDLNLTGGIFKLNIFLVGSEAQSNTVKQSILDAVSIFKDIYAQMNITISVEYINISSANGVLPNPILGSNFYEDAGNNARDNSVNLFIGTTISKDSTENTGNEFDFVVGVVSSIPVPAIPTKFTAVAISLNQHQGDDGVFSTDEVGVLAETLAHETGHYLGLFHPVEISFNDFDPLDDTKTCTSLEECKANGVVKNLMYPNVIEGVIQRTLTQDQGSVANRYILVN